MTYLLAMLMFFTSVRTSAQSYKFDVSREGGKPFYYSVKLREGNYNVKVLLGDKSAASHTTIKAECRRLMVEEVKTKKGEFKTIEFTVHVRDSLIRSAAGDSKVKLKARERDYLHWDVRGAWAPNFY